uniref:Avirulence protein AvrP4 n=1 Tax=Melampsora lini TaxID=5261 RepID=B2ZCR7_MELLI|nr:avirulence protein AvrP4 [Melampsora lini]
MLTMMGTQLRKIVLLSLILSISIVPMMCEFLEDARDIQGLSRKSGTKLEEDSDSSRNRQGNAESEKCMRPCLTNQDCSSVGCGSCTVSGCSG